MLATENFFIFLNFKITNCIAKLSLERSNENKKFFFQKSLFKLHYRENL